LVVQSFFWSPIDLFSLFNRILDNLPVAQVRERNDGGNTVKSYEHGFPVGFKAVTQEV
jgi:hypothetical protein